MIVLPAGSFMMGSPENEADRGGDEGPQHRVTLARSIAVGKFEITVKQYRQFAEETGKGGQQWRLIGYAQLPDDDYPVFWVRWQDAKDYVAWLSARTGKSYRLLTEAEWEYAARATSADVFEPGQTRGTANNNPDFHFSWTAPVGSYAPNGFGLYDMTSNISEWTEDCYVDSYEGSPTDGSAVEGQCNRRVVRGGYAYLSVAYLRVANRDWNYAVGVESGNPTGFRIARSF